MHSSCNFFNSHSLTYRPTGQYITLFKKSWKIWQKPHCASQSVRVRGSNLASFLEVFSSLYW